MVTVHGFSEEAGCYDVATLVGLSAIVLLACLTFGSYAVSNDEVVQHHYGQLILDYYRSGLTDRSVFHFDNLYLYGGLFDILAVLLAKIIHIDVYDLRHIMCAMIGVAGIGATAATARLIAGSRAGFLAGASLALCGAWYGGMFNHTKDIPFAAAMAGALYFLVRLARDLPKPRPAHIVAFGLLIGAALGIRVLARCWCSTQASPFCFARRGPSPAIFAPVSTSSRNHAPP